MTHIRKREYAQTKSMTPPTHLITESVSTDTDRLDPSWDGLWDLLQDDRFTEDSTTKDVSDLR